MSTLRVNTLQNAAGTGQPAMSGAAKAWVNFNGTGTVAIRAAFNVTSITDNGTGDYTVNFTNALEDANYAVTQAYQPDSSGWFSGSWSPRLLFIFSQSTSNLRVQSGYQSASSATADFNYLEFAVFR